MTITNVMIPAYVDKKQIKGGGINVVSMPITPEIADFWLKNYNFSNRPLSPPNVAFLANQMTSGQWVENNGGTISFNSECQLNDGQHRLAAIIKSGKTFNFLIVIGVAEAAFKVMDTGKARTGSDALAIEGYKNSTIMSSGCVFLILWEQKTHLTAEAAQFNRGKASKKISNTDICRFADKNKAKLISACSTALGYWRTGDRLVTATWLFALLYIFSQKDIKAAEKFIFRLATGADIEYGCSMYWLRQKLYNDKISDSSSIPKAVKLAYIIKVWNSERTNKPIRNLRFNPSKGEKIPTII
jgi:hypothetical protein